MADMRARGAQYFDYLETCGEALSQALELPTLVADIDWFRREGPMHPVTITGECRRVMEGALNALLGEEVAGLRGAGTIQRKIGLARRDGYVSPQVARRLEQIRIAGNRSAHESAAVDVDTCSMSLRNLDSFLRHLVKRLQISDAYESPSAPGVSGNLFVVQDMTLVRKAELASLIERNGALRREALEAQKRAREAELKIEEDLALIRELVGSIRTLMEDDEAQANELDDKARDVAAAIADEVGQARSALMTSKEHVEAVLSEHDYIAQLLGEGAHATWEQQRLMAFPLSTCARTNVLHVNGGGGTGKTLSILAKLIADVRGDQSKRGLFVCFNRSLADYVTGLLAHLPEECRRIQVVSYDMYVNSLVKAARIKDARYRGLAAYARDTRYPTGWHIVYKGETKRFVRAAMSQVAQRLPEFRGSYFLDFGDERCVEWVDDELEWIEERYDTLDDARARYPTDVRVGRGKAKLAGRARLPREQARSAILEVLVCYLRLLWEAHAYTISQATKRLMGSQALPSYDAIAVDEAQDFSLMRIRLLVRLRADKRAFMYIAGDEHQRLYQRDFTWIELNDDERIRGYTITLHKNLRNPPSVRCFADRLLGRKNTHGQASDDVAVFAATDTELLALLRSLGREHADETTVVIGRASKWSALAREAGLDMREVGVQAKADACNLYCSNVLKVKGLEFDNVVVDLCHTVVRSGGVEREREMRYVHFTRARRRLYIRYLGEPPELLRSLYADFIEGA